MIPHPFFLVGAERSGTTMLRLMLDHHPSIACLGEFEYAVDRMGENGEFPQLSDYYDYLATDRIFQSYHQTIDRGLTTYPQLIDDFLCQTRDRKPGATLVGATVHRHFDRLLAIWPDARFVHLLRDGRDVARSCIVMGWAGNMWTGVERWVEAEQLWASLKPRLAENSYIELTYEDLLTDPPGQLARICEFLGVPYETAMLEYPNGTTYEKPDPKYAFQWRRKLSEREVALAESRIAEMLVERGYPISDYPRIELSPEEKKRLLRQDYYARVRYRIGAYGPWLFAASYVSRRVGPKSIRSWVQNRINRKVQALVK